MSVIVGFYENAIFCEINEFLENPSKVWQNLNETTKKASSSNSGYKKMANLGDKGKFRQKWRVCQKMTNLARSYQRFDKNLKKVDKRDDKKGHLDKWRL